MYMHGKRYLYPYDLQARPKQLIYMAKETYVS